MPYVDTKITRNELYEKVWSKPMTHLAKEFGISDVALSKICKKLNVPKPERGYWAKLKAGKKVSKEALPPSKGRDEYTIKQYFPSEEDHKEQELYNESRNTLYKEFGVQQLIDFEKHLKNKIHVPDMLSDPCPELRKNLNLRRNKDTGVYECNFSNFYKLDLSEEEFYRALRISNALLKALIARKIPFERFKRADFFCSVMILGEWFAFKINERKFQTERKLTKKEKGEVRHHQRSFSKYIYTFSGKLRLTIRYKSQYIHSLMDGKKLQLEDRLNDFIIYLYKAAVGFKLNRIIQRKREEERYELDRRHWALADKKRKEQARIDALVRDAESWNKSKLVREYLKSLEQSLKDSSIDLSPQSEIGNWFSWAYQQADRLDPLKENPPSILDEEI